MVIKRKRGQAVVIISLEDYNSLEETAYLTRSPANAAKLVQSMRQSRKGKVVKKKLAGLAAYER